jgi:hypothetical protein
MSDVSRTEFDELKRRLGDALKTGQIARPSLGLIFLQVSAERDAINLATLSPYSHRGRRSPGSHEPSRLNRSVAKGRTPHDLRPMPELRGDSEIIPLAVVCPECDNVVRVTYPRAGPSS